MDYSASGIVALSFSLVVGLAIGLLASGCALAIHHMTRSKGGVTI